MKPRPQIPLASLSLADAMIESARRGPHIAPAARIVAGFNAYAATGIDPDRLKAASVALELLGDLPQ